MHKRRIFILVILCLTGISAFLFAKSQLPKNEQYIIHAARGRITPFRENPNQGRLILMQTHDTVTHFLPDHTATKIAIRPFLNRWPKFDPKASLIFQHQEQNTHLSLTLSYPYYDPADSVMTFDIVSKSDLSPYYDIYEVDLYVYE